MEVMTQQKWTYHTTRRFLMFMEIRTKNQKTRTIWEQCLLHVRFGMARTVDEVKDFIKTDSGLGSAELRLRALNCVDTEYNNFLNATKHGTYEEYVKRSEALRMQKQK